MAAEAAADRAGIRLSLPQQVLLALALGIATGLFFGPLVSWLTPVGQIFIKLLQITVLPLVSVSLIVGLGSLKLDQVKALGLRGGAVLLVLWLIGILLLLQVPLALPDWESGSFLSRSALAPAQPIDFLRLFIPSNPFNAFANALVPAVVMFSILLGIALIGVEQREQLLGPLRAVNDALRKIASAVSKLAPYGVFALMASLAGTFDAENLLRLQVYIVLYVLLCLTLAFWVLPALVTAVTPLRHKEVVAVLDTAMITAFATGSTLVVIPLLIQGCRELVDKVKAAGPEDEDDRQSSIEVLIPVFYPFPSLGSLLVLAFVLFAGWYIGSDVPSSDLPQLIGTGIPALFGGTFYTMPLMLDLLRLPSDLFEVFVSVDVITGRFGALLASMHYGIIGLLGTLALVRGLELRWRSLLRTLLTSAAVIAIVIFGVRFFYTNVVIAPYTLADTLRNLTLEGTPQPVVPHPLTAGSPIDLDGPASFDEILDRGVLRVCYDPEEYPTAYENTRTPPQLVGFHIEMAHRLARRRDLALSFLPVAGEDAAVEQLNRGACDLYAHSLPLSAGRARRYALTEPITEQAVGLVVKDHRRSEFRTWEQVREQGSDLRVGNAGLAENRLLLKNLLPQAAIVDIRTDDYGPALRADETLQLDAVADLAEDGAAWALLYPAYSVVIPQPIVQIPIAYAVARGNEDLRQAMNAWLAVEKAHGTVDQLFDYWMLGGAVERERPPRWSVIRNVLGWVE